MRLLLENKLWVARNSFIQSPWPSFPAIRRRLVTLLEIFLCFMNFGYTNIYWYSSQVLVLASQMTYHGVVHHVHHVNEYHVHHVHEHHIHNLRWRNTFHEYLFTEDDITIWTHARNRSWVLLRCVHVFMSQYVICCQLNYDRQPGCPGYECFAMSTEGWWQNNQSCGFLSVCHCTLYELYGGGWSSTFSFDLWSTRLISTSFSFGFSAAWAIMASALGFITAVVPIFTLSLHVPGVVIMK